MPIRPAHPVYFTKLVLENIRCFSERQELQLTNADGRPAAGHYLSVTMVLARLHFSSASLACVPYSVNLRTIAAA